MNTDIYRSKIKNIYKKVNFNFKNFSSESNEISYKIFSFYNKNVDKNFPLYQKKVFNLFGYKINQLTDYRLTHAEFINHVVQAEKKIDFLIFFDIDCIPTSPNTINILLSQLLDHKTMVGAAQSANHIDEGKNLYVGPFFLGISTKMLKELDYPDFREKEGQYDVAQYFSEKVRETKNYNIRYWWPTNIEVPRWKLHQSKMGFGLGTEYENLVYHAFESRKADDPRFLKKCKTILDQLSNI